MRLPVSAPDAFFVCWCLLDGKAGQSKQNGVISVNESPPASKLHEFFACRHHNMQRNIFSTNYTNFTTASHVNTTKKEGGLPQPAFPSVKVIRSLFNTSFQQSALFLHLPSKTGFKKPDKHLHLTSRLPITKNHIANLFCRALTLSVIALTFYFDR